MARLNRRDFLKALGLAGATAATACGWDDNWYRTPVEEILPYVVKPEQVTPGTPTFFATTVTTGPDAWPVTGRHRDGRVINVGANRQSGLATGVPKAALLELQRHYSPDRLKGPMAGDEPLSWEDGLERLAGAVRKAREEGRQVAWIGPPRSGAMAQLLDDFTDGHAYHWEPLGRSDEADAVELLYGERRLPRYRIAQAREVVSFGAPFLGTWGGTGLEADYAAARDPNRGHFIARFALVAPHRDQTGANADDWMAVKPGTEALAAFALARLVADASGYAGAAARLLSGVDPAANAAAAGLSVEALQALAKRFAGAEAAVAFPGATEDADLAIATALLNIVSGNAGKTWFPDGYAAPLHGTRHVAQLVADMKAGKVGVLLIDDNNPAYSLPAAVGFAEALAQVGLVVGLSSHPTESNAAAGLILPTADTLEDWGDEDLDGHVHILRQPTTSPLWDTRSLGDILLATARAAELEAPSVAAAAAMTPDDAATDGAPSGAATADVVTESDEVAEAGDAIEDTDVAGAPLFSTIPLGFAPTTWREYVRARWERQVWPRTGGAQDFRTFWIRSLQKGVVAFEAGADAPALAPKSYSPPTREAGGDVRLHLYAHPHRYDGRYAASPWAQEVADPMTGMVWGSWLEVSEELASELGLSDKDEVEVTTPAGTVALGVEVYPGLKGRSAALAFGQGHTAYGRYARDRGVNAFRLVDGSATDSMGNVLMVGGGATLKKTGRKADLVSTFGGDSDGGRYWGVAVNADELAKVGDEPAAHPGDLTGIHHLGRDARLAEKDRFNFYDPPDHPTYRFAMTVDTNACDGCGVCAIACYAENNLAIVGKSLIRRGREMNWLRINRYFETVTDAEGNEHSDVRFVPMMCQHCALAPCESVCPVLATYHNIDGLNAMVYNRCVGTRYCANNCPYVVRRFNFHSYVWPEPLHLQLNPDISVRTMGVMEKCTFCVQRTRRVKDAYRDQGFTETVPDAALRQLPACAEACPTGALTFGNLNDEASVPAQTRKSARSYVILSELNTHSAINYLAKASFHIEKPHHGHGGGHGDHAEGGHGDHGETHDGKGAGTHGNAGADTHEGEHKDAAHGADKHDDHGKAGHHEGGAGDHHDADEH
jgi:Fe-S-cluster-containing dehydrogenase component/anaerobic selenocysteine-containing dehydrogenase